MTSCPRFGKSIFATSCRCSGANSGSARADLTPSLRRSRLPYLLAGALVVVLGLASRRYGAGLPAFVAEYAGDTLWAVMAFIVIGVVAPDWPTRRVGVAALLACYADEVSQLYHAPWIEAIRNTRLGGVVLGYGFLWSDVACYTVGVALCVVIEHLVYARTSR
jgi:hypothetical protein